MFMKIRYIFSGILILMFLQVSLIYAKEIEYPISAFQEEELIAVREWEKKWAGQKITSTNVDEVKEFLPETLYDLIKNTNKWGESWFTVVPYNRIKPTPGDIEWTKKQYGTCRINPEGELEGWVAGMPFPEAQDDGRKIALNFRSRNAGDGYESVDRGFIIDGIRKYDRSLELQNNLAYFAGRTDFEPVPEFKHNPKDIWRAFSMLQLAPPETRNMRIMEIHYKDRLKPYDSWVWVSSLRRIRRRSTTERQASQSAGDNSGYDNMGWDGPMSELNFRYLGKEQYLLARHTDVTKLNRQPGFCLYNGIERERINVHILEVTPKDPNFFYSKMIWYQDPETWNMLYSDRYDRRGNLWKIQELLCYVSEEVDGISIPHFTGNQMIDVQRTHSTLGLSEQKFGIKFDQDMFTLQYMQRYGH